MGGTGFSIHTVSNYMTASHTHTWKTDDITIPQQNGKEKWNYVVQSIRYTYRKYVYTKGNF